MPSSPPSPLLPLPSSMPPSSVAEVIEHVARLHVITFREPHRYRNPEVVKAMLSSQAARGALVYYFTSGWMLSSTTSCHPGWPAAVRRALCTTEVVYDGMAAEWALDLALSESPDLPISADDEADRNSRLLKFLYALIGVGLQLHCCGPALAPTVHFPALPGPSAPLWGDQNLQPCKPWNHIIAELSKLVTEMNPRCEAAEEALFDLSCILARHKQEFFYSSIVDEFHRGLIGLRTPDVAARMTRLQYLLYLRIVYAPTP